MRTFNFRILSASLALAAMFALSQPARGAEPEFMLDMTAVSPEKRAIAGKLYDDFHNSTLAARQDLLAKRRELDAQIYSAQYDEQKVQSLAKEIADLRAKLYSARVALKDALIKEGIAFGHSSYGPGMGCGSGCCGSGGGYGPGMGRRHGPGMRRGYGGW